MLCPQCGSQQLDTDNFCANCGHALTTQAGGQGTPQPRFEYQDVTIPLKVESHADFESLAEQDPETAELVQTCDDTVSPLVQSFTADGWQLEQPINWPALARTGQLERRELNSLLGAIVPGQHRSFVYESVTLRFKRLVP